MGVHVEKPTIFICYSAKDERWKDRLVKQLEVLDQYYEYWTEGQIEGGEDRLNKLEEAIRAARVAIFLVSDDSLNRQFLGRKDVANLLERQKEDLRVIPLIVRNCAWNIVRWIDSLEVRPADKKPLRGKKAADVDTELTKLVVEISEIINRSAVSPGIATGLASRQDRAPTPAASTKANDEMSRVREELRKEKAKTAALRRQLSKHITKGKSISGLESQYEAKAAEVGSKKTENKPQF